MDRKEKVGSVCATQVLYASRQLTPIQIRSQLRMNWEGKAFLHAEPRDIQPRGTGNGKTTEKIPFDSI
jgi:hypothetical protein